jgi:predicted lysophospholipase L1 biosynthesis ABC-type transport system permease subunit
VLSWEGMLVAFVIVVIGLPLGVVSGNLVWRTLMDNVGLDVATVYEPWILAVPVVVFLVAVLCAVIPARRVRRTNVGALLRVE